MALVQCYHKRVHMVREVNLFYQMNCYSQQFSIWLRDIETVQEEQSNICIDLDIFAYVIEIGFSRGAGMNIHSFTETFIRFIFHSDYVISKICAASSKVPCSRFLVHVQIRYSSGV